MQMNRYLTVGLITMMFSSIFQYSWNAFELTLPLISGMNQYSLSLIFTLFIIVSSISQILSGYLADSLNPRSVYIFSLFLAALGLILSSLSRTVLQFSVFWIMGSIGEGSLYGISVNLALKWNENNRGFSAGFVGMGFGIGAVFANPFIFLFKNFRMPMMLLGIAMLMVLLFLAKFVEYPTTQGGRSPAQVIREAKWWLVFTSYSFAGSPLQLFSFFLIFLSVRFGISYLVLVTIIFPLISGIGRPFIGRISDRIGRTNTILFIVSAILIGSILAAVRTEISILLAAALISLFGGSLFTLYSSYVSDLYGSKYSTSNNGILYSGKAVAGITGVFIFTILDEAYGITSAMVFVVILVLASILSFAAASTGRVRRETSSV